MVVRPPLISHEDVEKSLDDALGIVRVPESRLVNAWFWVTGRRRCPCCQAWVPRWEIRNRRLNTQYADDASNWLVSCTFCFDDTVALYAEMWAEYYAARF